MGRAGGKRGALSTRKQVAEVVDQLVSYLCMTEATAKINDQLQRQQQQKQQQPSDSATSSNPRSARSTNTPRGPRSRHKSGPRYHDDDDDDGGDGSRDSEAGLTPPLSARKPRTSSAVHRRRARHSMQSAAADVTPPLSSRRSPRHSARRSARHRHRSSAARRRRSSKRHYTYKPSNDHRELIDTFFSVRFMQLDKLERQTVK